MFLWYPVLDLARAPRRTARKKGSGYENARGHVATPYSTSVSVPLYAITARGQLPRHIVRQFQSPYTPSPRGLSRISARQVALALASRFSRMLSFQIKEMEFTDEVTRGIRRSIPMMLCGLLSNLLWIAAVVSEDIREL